MTTPKLIMIGIGFTLFVLLAPTIVEFIANMTIVQWGQYGFLGLIALILFSKFKGKG